MVAQPADIGITLQPVNAASLVMFLTWHRASRYERFRRLVVLRGNAARLEFSGFSLTTGGTNEVLRSPRYTLLIDGVERAAVTVPAGTKISAFDVDLRGLPAGWRRLEIGGLAPGETNPVWFAFRVDGPVVEQAWMPVVRGTYEFVHHGDSAFAWARAPGRYAPTPRPLVRREYTPFATPLPRKDMMCHDLVPVRYGDVHRPNRSADGIVSSFDRQAYFWSDMIAALPAVALLDGPRGVGTISNTTHVEIGKAAPDGRPRNNVYACDPWRVVKIDETGTIKTLVGYRHAMTPHVDEWGKVDPPPPELIGDWSAVPADRRGFHELWGMAWDERTLVINEAAARIPAEGNDKPHVTGPVMFLADSQRNRIVRVAFSATSHTAPPRVTEFITGVLDPWDVVYYEGALFVTERGSHRIAVYDATTGAYLRTLVQGRALAVVDRNRSVQSLATLSAIQAEPCVAPEGLFKLENDPWLYFGSVAMQQVKRVHLETGAVEVVCAPPVDGNSKYFKIAIGDGTFGPRGTVFVWSWSNRHLGWPFTWVPPGSTYRNTQVWNWYEEYAAAGQWTGANYTTAGAVGRGRLISGGAQEGLSIISQRQPADPAITTAAQRGQEEYRARGLNLLHGAHGFGFFGLPLPWGVSGDIDAYLALQGHQRT